MCQAHAAHDREKRRHYLVGAVQGADELGDLLHHRQILLQVLELLEEPWRPKIHLILGGKTCIRRQRRS